MDSFNRMLRIKFDNITYGYREIREFGESNFFLSVYVNFPFYFTYLLNAIFEILYCSGVNVTSETRRRWQIIAFSRNIGLFKSFLWPHKNAPEFTN